MVTSYHLIALNVISTEKIIGTLFLAIVERESALLFYVNDDPPRKEARRRWTVKFTNIENFLTLQARVGEWFVLRHFHESEEHDIELSASAFMIKHWATSMILQSRNWEASLEQTFASIILKMRSSLSNIQHLESTAKL